MDRKHPAAEVDALGDVIAVGVGHRLVQQQRVRRRRQARQLVIVAGVAVPDVLVLGERHVAVRRHADREVQRAAAAVRRRADLAGDRAVRKLVQQDLAALPDAVAVARRDVGRIQRIQPRAGAVGRQRQRIVDMPRTVGAVMRRAAVEVAGKVGAGADRRSRQVGLVQRQLTCNRCRRRSQRRTVVVERQRLADVDAGRARSRVTVAIRDGVGPRQRDQVGCRQRHHVVRIGRVGMLQRVHLIQRHNAGRAHAHREVDHARRIRSPAGANPTLDHVAVDIQIDMLAGRNVDQPGVHARRLDAERVGRRRRARTVRAIAAGHREVVGKVRRRVDRQVGLVNHQRIRRRRCRHRDRRTIVKDRQMRADIDARACRLIVVVSHGGGQRDQTRCQRDPFIEVARCCLMNRAQIGQRHMTRGVNGDREDQIATDRRAPFHDAGRVDRQQNVLTGRRIDQTGIFVRGRDRQRIGQRLLAARYRDVERHLHRRDRCPCGSEPRTGDTMVGGRGQEALVDNQRRQGVAGNGRRRSNAQHEAGRRHRGHEVRQLFLRRQHVGRHRS